MSARNPHVFDRDQFRANLLPYTRRAFSMLPRIVRPRILDIGCGSGIATLELARLSEGNIVAVDVDKEALNKLVNNAVMEGLSKRITVMHTSMLEMDFPSNSFDIIWTEGAITFIGFERGLREWRSLQVQDGYLVIHDVLSDLEKKVELISACGYTTLGEFIIPPEIWWKKYYEPLKRHLEVFQRESALDKRTLNEIKAAAREIEEFDPKCDRFGSVFFILKKI